MKHTDERQNIVVHDYEQVPPREKFRGYTIEELRTRRQLVEVKRQFMAEKLHGEMSRLNKTPLLPAVGGGSSALFGLAGRVFKVLSYADYITLGLTLFQSGRRVAHLFKKKK